MWDFLKEWIFKPILGSFAGAAGSHVAGNLFGSSAKGDGPYPPWHAQRSQWRHREGWYTNRLNNVLGQPENIENLGGVELERLYSEMQHEDTLRRGMQTSEMSYGFEKRMLGDSMAAADRLHSSTSQREYGLAQDHADAHVARMTGLGLTPQEMVGAPAPGRSSGSTSGVMGNGPSVAEGQRVAQDRQNAMLQSATQMSIAKMQTDAQIKSAVIGAGATSGSAVLGSRANVESSHIAAAGGTDVANIQSRASRDAATISAAPAHRQAAVQERLARLAELMAPHERAVVANNALTSAPDYVRYLKRLGMGPDNVLMETIITMSGFDPFDVDSVSTMTLEQRMDFLRAVVAVKSDLVHGMAALQEMFPGLFASGSAVDNSMNRVIGRGAASSGRRPPPPRNSPAPRSRPAMQFRRN